MPVSREELERRRQLGLCRCGRQPRKSRLSCEKCAQGTARRYEKQGSAKREALFAAGICEVCGLPAEVGRRKCGTHLREDRERATSARTQHQSDRRGVGLCLGAKCTCPNPALPGQDFCKQHAKRTIQEVNAIGRRFGSIVVERLSHQGQKGPVFVCRCDCGGELLVPDFRLGKAKSCGCGASLSRLSTDAKEAAARKFVGRRFGSLLVQDVTPVIRPRGNGEVRMWHLDCLCTCGERAVRAATYLLKAERLHVDTSCGCRKPAATGRAARSRNEIKAKRSIGKRFGRLVVVSVELRRSGTSSLWHANCRCDCGQTASVALKSLRKGDTRSCGCYHQELRSKLGSEVCERNVRALTRVWNHSTPTGQSLRLRSGFEKMYAEALDAGRVDWFYELHTFILAPDCRYKPDFYLPETDEWIEVKGRHIGRSEEKIALFRATGRKLTVLMQADLEALHPLTYLQFLRQSDAPRLPRKPRGPKVQRTLF